MHDSERERVENLVGEAWKLLEASQPREAVDLFGRVLLQDPEQLEARRGLGLARARAGELERELEGRLEEAGAAVEAGQMGRARVLLDEVILLGGDRDRARALLDRIDVRGGRVAETVEARPAESPSEAAEEAASGLRAWSRTAFATACGVAFAAVALAVAASWERLLWTLERRPSPASYAASAAPGPLPSQGERAVSEAQRRLERGDPAGALTVLAEVPSDDPVYPFALQLRQRAANTPAAPVAEK